MKIRDKVLVVDDERSIRNLVTAILEANCYDTLSAATGGEALMLFYSHRPDVIILDLGLPDLDGMSVLERIRKDSDTPVIIVSARAFESDKVRALDAGADDYMTKPFGNGELLARVRSAIRHTRTSLANTDLARLGKYRTGELVVDYDKHVALVGGKDVRLTPNEFRIVALLAKHAGRVLTQEYMVREIWGGIKENTSLRVHMANIRRKIEKNPAEPHYIFTEIGVGYFMREADTDTQ